MEFCQDLQPPSHLVRRFHHHSSNGHSVHIDSAWNLWLPMSYSLLLVWNSTQLNCFDHLVYPSLPCPVWMAGFRRIRSLTRFFHLTLSSVSLWSRPSQQRSSLIMSCHHWFGRPRPRSSLPSFHALSWYLHPAPVYRHGQTIWVFSPHDILDGYNLANRPNSMVPPYLLVAKSSRHYR